MRFLSKASGGSMVSRARRRPPLSLEMLESRDLKAAGVTLTSGVLTIVGTQTSGNAAQVSINAANNAVRVTLNGESVDFDASQVTRIAYVGGLGGGDTYRNDTSLSSYNFAYGGNNNFVGGTGNDVFFLHGTNNTVDGKGGGDVVFNNGGNNTVVAYAGQFVI